MVTRGLNPSQDVSDIIEVRTYLAQLVFSERCCQELKYYVQKIYQKK